MRTISIPVANCTESELALDAVFKMGKAFKADVSGFHVKPGVDVVTSQDLAALWSAGGSPMSSWTSTSPGREDSEAKAAAGLFAKKAEKHGYRIAKKPGTADNPHAVFKTWTGTPELVIPRVAPASDMMAVTRPDPKGGLKAWVIMMTAIQDAGMPTLLLPIKPKALSWRRIAVAWNNAHREALLVHLSLDLLKAADDVVFLTEGKGEGKGATAAEMAAYLKSMGIKARTEKITGRNTGKAIVKAMEKEKSDLLLSGAYTRGRLRQMLFGGVTEYLVTGTQVPVLLLHGA